MSVRALVALVAVCLLTGAVTVAAIRLTLVDAADGSWCGGSPLAAPCPERGAP